jgi:hypothetical protein
MIFLLALTSMQSAMGYEEPEYKVLSKTTDFEIREYAEHIVAEVDVAGSMGDTGNAAFRILAGYIFGGNAGGEEMNMTAPVETRSGGEDSYTYTFMMERKYTFDSLPEPNDPRIRLVQRPSRIMAVRSYSGSWREAKMRENIEALLAALDAAGLEYTGEPILARYDSPFTLWFLRRNEVMIELPVRQSATQSGGA